MGPEPLEAPNGLVQVMLSSNLNFVKVTIQRDDPLSTISLVSAPKALVQVGGAPKWAMKMISGRGRRRGGVAFGVRRPGRTKLLYTLGARVRMSRPDARCGEGDLRTPPASLSADPQIDLRIERTFPRRHHHRGHGDADVWTLAIVWQSESPNTVVHLISSGLQKGIKNRGAWRASWKRHDAKESSV